MRQHMLNGWLVAALVAVICLLGTTAYTEIRKELPSVACKHDRTVDSQRGARVEMCAQSAAAIPRQRPDGPGA
jgi:hypothetical protein